MPEETCFASAGEKHLLILKECKYDLLKINRLKSTEKAGSFLTLPFAFSSLANVFEFLLVFYARSGNANLQREEANPSVGIEQVSINSDVA